MRPSRSPTGTALARRGTPKPASDHVGFQPSDSGEREHLFGASLVRQGRAVSDQNNVTVNTERQWALGVGLAALAVMTASFGASRRSLRSATRGKLARIVANRTSQRPAS